MNPTTGTFIEIETGNHFAYEPLPRGEFPEIWNVTHLVHVGYHEARAAIVRKTVAHIAVDVNVDGSPVFETWAIRQNCVS